MSASWQSLLPDLAPEADLSICVDLDGALVRTDTFLECLFALLARRPLSALLFPLWLLRGWAAFKHEVARRSDLRVENLPYREGLLNWLRGRREAGARLVLVTRSDRLVAERVAQHAGCFDSIFASEASVNRKGATRSQALLKYLSNSRWGYVSNGRGDLALWRRAGWVVAVNPGLRLRRAIRRGQIRADSILDDRPPLGKALLRAARLVQWSKNVLLFVPLLVSHKFTDPKRFLDVLTAFLAFGLYASALYMINDLLDLDADRCHPVKSKRPFAAGDLPLTVPLVASPALMAVAALLALRIGWELLLWLLVYALLSLSYVSFFKARLLLDVIVLAGLYTIRLWAGGAAAHVSVSPWLAAFGLFLFLSLALAKRCSELWATSAPNQPVPGRDYTPEDTGLLEAFGCASAYLSCLVLALYINSPDVVRLYKRPPFLWLLVPILVYWTSRLWLLARRGQVKQDPVLFTLTDRTSWGVALVSLSILLAAGMQ